MKPKSLAALLLLSALSVQAEVLMVAGKVYDVGKGSYSSDTSVTDRNDTGLCWAATAANTFQHWQDWYLDWYTTPGNDPDAAEGEESPVYTGVPDGFADPAYTKPSGTQYLNIYKEFVANFKDDGGIYPWASAWYFDGVEEGEFLKDGASSGGYLPGKVETYSAFFGYHFDDLAGMKQVLDIPFGFAGVAVYMGITNPKGEGHAITCWGYETDGDGTLTALYITDSDDRQYGAHRVDVQEKDGQIVISSPYLNNPYNSATYHILELSFIANTGSIYTKDGNFILDELPEDNVIDMAVDMTSQQLGTGAGLSIASEGMLVASGGEGTSLTIGGGAERAEGTGLTASAGSMISLNDTALDISRFEGNGLTVNCEVNVSGGSVAVTDNGGVGIAVQGTDDNPKAFLQMNGNDMVEISRNDKGGLVVDGSVMDAPNRPGSAYATSDAALLQHNTKINICSNSSAEGAGAYVAGSLEILHNGTLTIAGNTAEHGSALYIASKDIPSSTISGALFQVRGDVTISDNTRVDITGNESTEADVIAALGRNLTISDNGRVTVKGNDANTSTAEADGYVVHNTGTLTITNNKSLTFADNKAQYDIYNEGTLNLSAGDGQSITFEHGLRNSAKGTASIGRLSEGRGTYSFKQGGSSVSMTAESGTIRANGGAVMQQNGDKAGVSLSKASLNDVEFCMEAVSLELTDVVFSGDVTVNLGYYADVNLLTLTDVTFDSGSTLFLVLDLGSEAGKPMPFMSLSGSDSTELTEVTVNVGDYIAADTSLNGVKLALTLTGTIADDALLIVNPGELNLSHANVEAPDCIYKRTADGKLYYGAPEPTTATLSLLALSLLLRRRRKASSNGSWADCKSKAR